MSKRKSSESVSVLVTNKRVARSLPVVEKRITRSSTNTEKPSSPTIKPKTSNIRMRKTAVNKKQSVDDDDDDKENKGGYVKEKKNKEIIPSGSSDEENESKYNAVDQENESKDNAVDEAKESNEQSLSNKAQPLIGHKKDYIVYKIGSNNEEFIISKTADFWSTKYCKQISHCSPDNYGLYIYNDFNGYGQLEAVENCIKDITTLFYTHTITSKQRKDDVNYVNAFRRIEALNIVLDYADDMPSIDDGDRFQQFMRVIGACYVTICQNLLPKPMLTLQKKDEALKKSMEKSLKKILSQIPNFKFVLERAIKIGYPMSTVGDTSTVYTKILSIIYRNWCLFVENVEIDLNQLFDNKKDKDLIKILREANQMELGELDDDEEEFEFLEEYANYSSGRQVGGDQYDISKWSKTKREQYSLDRVDDMDFNFG
ncbi:unnamed protein product [Didymodactylos carnosus]|uniref:Uncharacterized protein n=1 Tax=Didymodactylos carnosus TaxID=1234261 RepID=A0A814GLN7_9BILA|nr:unnamed protein product [Didymodactylos carnosus]CAF0997924.1 unnamed protein product [Didymodactylos carnosus]CAF3568675.1 unnamed protein product [Didymodactylos carnosus]CAF3769473.1 unnamed protein product [Didymodactylos carnosus]